jgi:hypothetical protein
MLKLRKQEYFLLLLMNGIVPVLLHTIVLLASGRIEPPAIKAK